MDPGSGARDDSPMRCGFVPDGNGALPPKFLGPQSRRSSFGEVLARVFSSTVFTMTAQ